MSWGSSPRSGPASLNSWTVWGATWWGWILRNILFQSVLLDLGQASEGHSVVVIPSSSRTCVYTLDWTVVCLMCSAGVCTVSIPVHPVNLRLSVQRLVMPTNEIIWQSVGVLGSISDEHKKEYRALVGNLWSGLKGIIWLCVWIRTETMTDFNRKRTALWPVSILTQDADVMFEYKHWGLHINNWLNCNTNTDTVYFLWSWESCVCAVKLRFSISHVCRVQCAGAGDTVDSHLSPSFLLLKQTVFWNF